MAGAATTPPVELRYVLDGGFEIDPLRRELCTAAGDPLELSGRAFDLLLQLVARRGPDASRRRKP